MRKLINTTLVVALFLATNMAYGQKVKTKLVTFRGITMKVVETAPDLNTQDATASLKVSDGIMIQFRVMFNAANAEMAAKEHADKYWETKSKERGIPMAMELTNVSYYYIPGEDAKGSGNYLLGGAAAHGEYYGIYVSYSNPADAKGMKKALRSIKAAKSAPSPIEAPKIKVKEVAFKGLTFEVPQDAKVSVEDGKVTVFVDNMFNFIIENVDLQETIDFYSNKRVKEYKDELTEQRNDYSSDYIAYWYENKWSAKVERKDGKLLLTRKKDNGLSISYGVASNSLGMTSYIGGLVQSNAINSALIVNVLQKNAEDEAMDMLNSIKRK